VFCVAAYSLLYFLGVVFGQRPRQRGDDTKKTTTKNRRQRKTPSDITGTIPQDTESFINFTLFEICDKQICDTESEEMLVHFHLIYSIL
jgi:hypothetical protein